MGGISNLLGGQTNQQAANVQTLQYGGGGQQAQDQLNQAVQGQNALAQQLQTQAQGGGPNPAGQQLQNAMAANTASANAQAASQRGINPGLAARQAMESSGQFNQQAAGTAAQAAMQQQLNAQQQLAGLRNTQVGQSLQASQAPAAIQAQLAQANANNAQTAGGGFASGIGFGGIQSLADGGAVLRQKFSKGRSRFDMGGGVDPLSASGKEGGDVSPTALLALLAKGGEVLRKKFDMGGGTDPLSASGKEGGDVSPTALLSLLADGGYIPSTPEVKLEGVSSNPFGGKKKKGAANEAIKAVGNSKKSNDSKPVYDQSYGPQATGLETAAPWDRAAPVQGAVDGPQTQAQAGPQSYIGKALNGLWGDVQNTVSQTGKTLSAIGDEPGKMMNDLGLGSSSPAPQDEMQSNARGPTPVAEDPPAMAKGGQVPALVSPQERYLNPSEVKKVAKGEKSPMKAGEEIPGKAKVKGAVNSYANDTVKKTLKAGGIVLPRNITLSPDAEKKAMAFIQAIEAKKKGKKL